MTAFVFISPDSLNEIQSQLDAVAKHLDMEPIFDQIGDALVSSTQLRFRDGVSPEGKPWANLSPVTIKRRRKKGKGGVQILVDTGVLRGSIAKRVANNELLVGTDKRYGGTQQLGTRQGQYGRMARGNPIPWGDIPARPYLGLSKEDIEEIKEIIGRALVI